MITRRSAAIGAFGVWLSSCNRTSPNSQVVLYSSLDESYATGIARLFESDTGIKVKLVADTEAAKSTGLVNRLHFERERPVCDVFFSGDIARAELIKRQGLSAFWTGGSTEATGKMNDYDDADGHYASLAARLRVIILNTTMSSQAQGPQSVLDLALPEFAPRGCMANPLFGTTSMHMAAMAAHDGRDKVRNFLESFSRNGGRMLGSNGEVRRRVAAGEFAFGLTDSDDVSVALRDEKPVDFIVPDQKRMGVVVVPCAVSIMKGAPHPEEAHKLARFLASARVEDWLAKCEAAHLPLHHSVVPPKIFGRGLASFQRFSCAPDDLAVEMEALTEGFLPQWVDQQMR